MYKYFTKYVSGNREKYAKLNIQIEESNNLDKNANGTFIDFFIPEKRIGRITIWENGMTDYEAMDYSGVQLFWYHEEYKCEEKIINGVDIFIEKLLSCQNQLT